MELVPGFLEQALRTAGFEDIKTFECKSDTEMVWHFSKIYEGYITLLVSPLPRHFLEKITMKDQVAGAGFRPAEIAKLAIVLWSADLFARKQRLLHQPKHVLLPMLPVTGFVAMLVVLQRDLGTALVLFAIILGLLFVAGLPGRLFLVSLLGVGAVILVFVRSSAERLQRITSFTDPFADAQSSGYQAAHGLMGLATGQWLGVGLGGSRQKWGSLPGAHTDFVFAVIGEELGLVGALSVLLLFGLLAYVGFRIARRARDPFCRFAAAGITASSG